MTTFISTPLFRETNPAFASGKYFPLFGVPPLLAEATIKALMPYRTDPHTNAYEPDKNLPHHLGHKPVFALPYQKFDGDNPPTTDAQWITVGIAQWDEASVSVKIMRHSGNRWSAQSEELPLHRPIDMTLFLAQLIFGENPNGTVTIPSGTLTNQTSSSIIITPENQRDADEMERYENALQETRDLIKERLNALYSVLDTLKRAKRI